MLFSSVICFILISLSASTANGIDVPDDNLRQDELMQILKNLDCINDGYLCRLSYVKCVTEFISKASQGGSIVDDRQRIHQFFVSHVPSNCGMPRKRRKVLGIFSKKNKNKNSQNGGQTAAPHVKPMTATDPHVKNGYPTMDKTKNNAYGQGKGGLIPLAPSFGFNVNSNPGHNLPSYGPYNQPQPLIPHINPYPQQSPGFYNPPQTGPNIPASNGQSDTPSNTPYNRPPRNGSNEVMRLSCRPYLFILALSVANWLLIISC